MEIFGGCEKTALKKGEGVALSASESSERVREEDGISRNMPQRKSADSTYPT